MINDIPAPCGDMTRESFKTPNGHTGKVSQRHVARCSFSLGDPGGFPYFVGCQPFNMTLGFVENLGFSVPFEMIENPKWRQSRP